MSDHSPPNGDRLSAYVDGELPEHERAEFDRAVARDPELASMVAKYRADMARLAGAYGHIAEQPLPAHWLATIERHRAGRSGAARDRALLHSWRSLAAAAATLLVVIVGVATYRLVEAPREEAIVQEALAARDGALTPLRVETFGRPDATPAASRAMAGALAMHLSAPDLSRMGYRLASLTLYDRVGGRAAAELRYRGADGRIFALYLRRASGAPRFDQYKDKDLRICIWQDDVLGAVMTGPMTAAEMQRLAALAYAGLES